MRHRPASELALTGRSSKIAADDEYALYSVVVFKRVHDEFAQKWYEGALSTSRANHLVRQFPWIPWIVPLMTWLPKPAPETRSGGIVAETNRGFELMRQVTAVVDRHSRGEKRRGSDLTIFDSMLDADAPPEEKTISRLTEEAQVLTGAGSLSR